MSDMTGFLSLSEKLKDLDTLLDNVLDGKKPLLDPENPKDKNFIDFLHGLYPENFDQAYSRSLDTRPEGYYITPEQRKNGQAKLVKQLNTQVHPLHENLHKVNHTLFGRASKIQLHNFVVAGADLHFRDRRDYVGAYARSPNFFLHDKGDVVSLSQTVKLLRQVISGTDRGDRAVLIDNTTGRFTPVLRMLELDYPEAIDSLNDKLQKNRRSARIAVVEEKNTAIGRMKAIAFSAETTLPVLPQLISTKTFQSTSSQEKVEDIRLALHDQRSKLKIKDAVALGGHSEHDPEFQYTFAGNDFAKAYLTIQEKQKNPFVANVLEQLDIDEDQAGIFFYDGGESCAERGLRETQAFAPYLSETHPFAEFPGAETKPLSNAVGAKSDYYITLENGLKEIEKTEGRKADTRFLDNCVVLYMPLQQEDMRNPRYYAFKATTMLETHFDLNPFLSVNQEDDALKTQRHYQRPIDRLQTLAELEEDRDPWMVKEMAISKAIRGFSDAAHIPKRKIDLKADYDRVKDLVVHCPYPIPKENEDELRAKFENQGLQLEVRAKPIQSLEDVRETINNVKALVFPNVISGQGERFYTNRIFLPSSAIVEKQLSNPKINGLPIALLRDADHLSEFEQIANHLKRANMVAQDMRHLYSGSSKVKKLANYIKESRLFQEVYDAFEEHPKIDLPTSENAVVFLESATSKHPVDIESSYVLPVNCGLNGFDSISGFGMSGPMGMVSWAGMQLRVEGWKNHKVMGVQDPNAMKTEGAPFEAMRKIMGEEYGLVAPNIFVRMWQMLQMDALQHNPDMEMIAVAQACGIGGLQEISFILALKELNVPGADRINLIIENTKRELPSGIIAPHDVLLEIMDKRGDLSIDNNLYASSTTKETLKQIARISGQPMIYYPVENPVDTVHPFEDVKNPLLSWLMGTAQWNSPAKTIRQVYNEVKQQQDLDLDYS